MFPIYRPAVPSAWPIIGWTMLFDFASDLAIDIMRDGHSAAGIFFLLVSLVPIGFAISRVGAISKARGR